MTKKVEIEAAGLPKLSVLKFPQRCVNCGGPPADKIGMSFAPGSANQSKQTKLELWLPYCAACANRERKMFLFALGPFAFGFLLVGIAVFILVWLVAPQGNTVQTMNIDVALAGAAGLFAGMIGGGVFEFVSKFVLAPFLGQSFARRPLFIFELLSETNHALGVTAQYDSKKKILTMTFERDEFAQEFMALNQLS